MQFMINKKNFDFLKTESELWVAHKYITQDQRQQLLSVYIQEEQEQVTRNRLTMTMAILGALLVGAGVIMFFASNWQALSKLSKLAIIFGTIVASYGSGYYLAWWKASSPKVGHSLIFLGTIMFGAAIHLVAQVYHIEAHYPNGVLFWLLGILPMAWACKSRPILWESIILLTLWANLEVQGFHNLSILFWPLLLLGIVPLVYKLKSGVGLSLALLSAYLWLAQTNIWWESGGLLSPTVVLMVALAMYLLGGHRFNIRIDGFQSTIQGISLGVALFALFVMTFDIYSWVSEMSRLMGFFLAVAVAGLVFLGIVIYSVLKEEFVRTEVIAIGLTVLVTATVNIAWTLGMDDTFAILTTNLVLFCIILWVVYYGYITQRPYMVNIGLFAFVIDLIARYFDFLWDLLDKSVFFIVGGLVLLIGGSYLEKKRRQMLSQMGGTTYEQA